MSDTGKIEYSPDYKSELPSYKAMRIRAAKLHGHLQAIVRWESEHGTSVLARIAELEAEIRTIRHELQGHPDSLLTGKNGLCQATMREIELLQRQLVRKVALEHSGMFNAALDDVLALPREVVYSLSANDDESFELILVSDIENLRKGEDNGTSD